MFLLSIFVGFPAGAVGLFIHWRWQPTGAGDLFFMDRRWPFLSDAEAAAGRCRAARAATLGHAAVRAQELLRRQPFPLPSRAAAEAPAPIPDRGFIFYVSAARRRARRWLPQAAGASAPP